MDFAIRLRQERLRRQLSQEALAEALGVSPRSVQRWEQGQAVPLASVRLQISCFFGLSSQDLFADTEIASPSSLVWNVPYRRNPHFTGRDELLDQLARQLSPEKQTDVLLTRQAVLSQPQAIKGLGGIGKTQIALEYAYRSRQQGRYASIFWINAANEEAIITSFLQLVDLLPAFSARGETNQQQVIAAIKSWLEQCQDPWLLIFDNADELALIQPYLPQQGYGSILLTTRTHAVAALAASIEVDQMGMLEGTRFLLHRTQRLQASDEECNEASNIVIALDGFPLALDQAGAYIEETGCSFGDYLRLYERHRKKLLARRGRQATNYPDSVATTWDLSFQKVEQAHPAAAELLRLCASLSPDHIPEELLTEGAAHWPPALQQAVADPFTFNELIEALLSFSLVKRLAEEHLLSIHRLVQAVQLDRMEPEEQRAWVQRVVCAVNTLFPADPKYEIGSWPKCLRYLEQVQACDRLIQEHSLHPIEASDLLNRAGTYLREHASYSIAESLFRRALAIAEQQAKPEYLQLATSLNNLSILYGQQGKYEQAEPLLQRALHLREEALGSEHFQVASSLNNLSILYVQQGKYEQAEPLLQRALHIREKALGSEHFQVASSLNNLSMLYVQQGKYNQAETYYQRALYIREKALGPEHPDTASSLANLGHICIQQGRYEQAEPLLQRAWQVWEQALGPEHPQVANCLDNLGYVSIQQSKYEQAEPLLQRGLQIREQALNPHHPDIAFSLTNLGLLCFKQGQYEQAQPLYQRALHILEQTLGSHHFQVAEPLNGLANLLRERGQYEQAEAFYQRARSLLQSTPDSQRPEVAETLYNLARLRQMQHNYAEARVLYQQALEIRELVLGVEHPKTIETRESLLACACEDAGYIAEK